MKLDHQVKGGVHTSFTGSKHSHGWLRVRNGQSRDVLQSQLCRFEERIGMRIFEGRGSLRAQLPLSWRDPEGLTHTEGEQGRHSDLFHLQR